MTIEDLSREKFLEGLDFSRPQRRHTSTEDVTIILHEIKDARKFRIDITWRNDSFNKIGGKGFAWAIHKDRLIFVEDNKGWAFTQASKNNQYSYISYDPRLEPFFGDHDLKHDDFYDYYYVEAKDVNE